MINKAASELRFRHARLSEAHSILQRDYASSIERVEELEAEAATRQAAHEQLAIEKEAAEANAAAAWAEAERVRTDAEAQYAAAAAQAEAARLQTEAARLQAEKDALAAINGQLVDAATTHANAFANAVAEAARGVEDDRCARAAVEGARIAELASDVASFRSKIAQLRSDVADERASRQSVEAELSEAVDAGRAATREVERLRLDAKNAAATLDEALKGKAQAERRADAAEKVANEREAYQLSMAEKLRNTVRNADHRVASAMEEAAAQLAAEHDKFQKERARALALETSAAEMARTIAALESQLEFVSTVSRGSQFAIFVKLKEENEDLRVKLEELERTLRCAKAPFPPHKRLPSSSPAVPESTPRAFMRRRPSHSTAGHSAMDALEQQS